MKYLVGSAALLVATTFLCLANLRVDDNGIPAGATRIPDYGWDEIQAIRLKAVNLDEQKFGRDRFHATLAAAKQHLREERAGLAEAADVVCAAAERDNGPLLGILKDRFPTLTPRERIALLLLGHLREDLAAQEASDSGILESLSCEMSAWPTVGGDALKALAESH